MNLGSLKTWAKRIKRDGVTLWFAGKHPATPWYAKALGLFVVAYALSPIDLIPDFIPVLGYVDDVLLLPVLIYLTIRMLPADVLSDCRMQADAWMAAEGKKPISRVGAVAIVVIWVAVAAALWVWLAPNWQDASRSR
ncbi:YkvA family protein [Variovorax sp. RHLX14]|uniref:YkvA family protein n=1 Tax=Variovorax sp. RHLX14 TaxID=1259731 RepID=UPI003F48B996